MTAPISLVSTSAPAIPMPSPMLTRPSPSRMTSPSTRLRRRAERHADPELLRALVDREGDHAGDACRGDDQREQPEDADQRHDHAPRRQRRRPDFGQGAEVGHRQLRIVLARGRLDWRVASSMVSRECTTQVVPKNGACRSGT